jgi:membrane protein DedA with SNARE-associated domain
VIGALAAAENVFPPLPADTAVAIGAFLSTAGTVSALYVFLITWVANVTTATSVYLAGRTVGRSFFRGRIGRRLMHPRRLARLEQWYRHYGGWGIFVSRFIPGIRGVVPPFAGVAHLGFWRAVPPMALASGLWYAVLVISAAAMVKRANDVMVFVGHVNRIGLIAAIVMVAGGAIAWWRRRSRPSPPTSHRSPLRSDDEEC